MSIVDDVLGICAVTLSLAVAGCGAADEGTRREEAVTSGAAALTSYGASVTGVRVIGHRVVLLSCAGAGLRRVNVRANPFGEVDGSVASGIASVSVPTAEFEALMNAPSVSFVMLTVEDERVTSFDFAM